jgi:hypothetical protein
VSGTRLSRVARIVFDEDAYALLVEHTPRRVRQVVERLYAGESPAKLLKSGSVDVDTLEPILLDLARRGAMRGVIGNAGEDLVAEARAARTADQPIQLASPLSVVPPPPNPVISVLPDAPGAAVPIGGLPGLLEVHAGDPELPEAARPTPVPRSGPDPHSVVVALPLPAKLPAVAVDTAAPSPHRAQGEDKPSATHGAQAHGPDAVHAAQQADAAARTEEARISHNERRSHAQQAAAARAREASLTDASELAAAAAEARRSRSTLASWTVALLGLFAVALFVAREPEGGAMPEALGGVPTPAPPVAKPKTPSARPSTSLLKSADDNGFAVYDGFVDSAVEVPPGHAQLIIEASSAPEDAVVFVNDRELGALPQTLSLPEGVHELAIKRGDAISYRFVSVHPGKTWVLRNP